MLSCCSCKITNICWPMTVTVFQPRLKTTCSRNPANYLLSRVVCCQSFLVIAWRRLTIPILTCLKVSKKDDQLTNLNARRPGGPQNKEPQRGQQSRTANKKKTCSSRLHMVMLIGGAKFHKEGRQVGHASVRAGKNERGGW